MMSSSSSERSTISPVFGLLLLAGLFIVLFAFRNKSSDVPVVPGGCTGPECTSTIQCGILSPSTIVPCGASGGICQSCQCSSDPNARLGCMNCQTVKEKERLLDIPQSSCTGQYVTWDNGCYLKPGSYCLPATVSDVPCNQYTGRKVLSLVDGTYQWKCICINDTMFTNAGSDGDCSGINLCGLEGSRDNPRLRPIPRALIYKYSDPNAPEYWTSESQWNPFPSAGNVSCLCAPDEVADNVHMACVPASCSPGQTDSSDATNCLCPSGFVSCRDIAYRDDPLSGVYYTGACKIPSCVPDPCGAGGHLCTPGMTGCKEGTCVCDVDGYYRTNTSGSAFPETCAKLCDNNGPCSDRGTCYVNDTKPTTWLLSNMAGSDGFLIQTEDSKVSWVTVGGGINAVVTGAGSLYQLEAVCTGCAGKNVTLLVSNSDYYIKSNGLYYDILTNTFQPKSDLSFRITLKAKQSAAYAGNIFLFLLPEKYQYISYDNTATLKLNTSFYGTARCTNCNGHAQDEQNLCNGPVCGKTYEYCDPNKPTCCDGLSCKFHYTYPAGYYRCE